MTEIKAIIFDIDGTLTLRNSWNFLAEYLGVSEADERNNYLAWKEGKISYAEADANILKMWNKFGRGNKLEFTKAFESIPLRPDAKDLIEYLQSKGIVICLITGAMDLYAKVIAERLEIKYYYSNAVLNWSKQDEILSFEYNEKQDVKKLEQFHEFIKNKNLSPEECVAVGDSENDYLLFLETKKGIAIRTEFEEKILESVAWKIVDNLSEIKEII